jgi:hypothetical protein
MRLGSVYPAVGEMAISCLPRSFSLRRLAFVALFRACTASMRLRYVFLVSCLPSLHRLGLGFVSYASTVYRLLSLLYPYKSMQYM